MADALKGRNIDYRDEEVAETPWGPDIPVHPARSISPGMRAALARYRRARAARSGGADSAVDAVEPVDGIDSIRNDRI